MRTAFLNVLFTVENSHRWIFEWNYTKEIWENNWASLKTQYFLQSRKNRGSSILVIFFFYSNDLLIFWKLTN